MLVNANLLFSTFNVLTTSEDQKKVFTSRFGQKKCRLNRTASRNSFFGLYIILKVENKRFFTFFNSNQLQPTSSTKF